MKTMLVADGRSAAGGTPLLMHNERLSDPLDPHARDLAKVTKLRNKTEADHLEAAHIEFLGGLYTNGNGPCLPGWNIIRCLQEGATRQKRGRDVLRGVFPLQEHADVEYDGPRDPEELWHLPAFWLRKGVVVSGRRIIRTRPMFSEWQLRLPVEVDQTIFDLDVLAHCWADAGRFVGIGDMRPIYGKFEGTLEIAKEAKKK